MKFLNQTKHNPIVGTIIAMLLAIVVTTFGLKAEAHNTSWYGPGFHGRLTANGERYDMYAMTAAHKTLPFGTIVKVTNVRNGKSIKVRINDRGPYVGKRVIDLSKAAHLAIDCHLCTTTLEIVKQGDGATYHHGKKSVKKTKKKSNKYTKPKKTKTKKYKKTKRSSKYKSRR